MRTTNCIPTREAIDRALPCTGRGSPCRSRSEQRVRIGMQPRQRGGRYTCHMHRAPGDTYVHRMHSHTMRRRHGLHRIDDEARGRRAACAREPVCVCVAALQRAGDIWVPRPGGPALAIRSTL